MYKSRPGEGFECVSWSVSVSLSLSLLSQSCQSDSGRKLEIKHISITYLSLFLSCSLSLHLRFSVSPRNSCCVPSVPDFCCCFPTISELCICRDCCFPSMLVVLVVDVLSLCMLACLLCNSLVNNLLHIGDFLGLVCSQGEEINTVWYLCLDLGSICLRPIVPSATCTTSRYSLCCIFRV